MGFFDTTPEGRNAFLRKKHKSPLRKRALEILGEDGPFLLEKMRALEPEAQGSNDWARKVLRLCARKKNQSERLKYVRACIRRHQRIHELSDWLINTSDPADNLDPEEYRSLTAEERRQLGNYYQKLHNAEIEFAVRTGEKSAVLLLALKVGKQRAIELSVKLVCALGEKDAERIMLQACEPTTRKIESYISAAIRNGTEG